MKHVKDVGLRYKLCPALLPQCQCSHDPLAQLGEPAALTGLAWQVELECLIFDLIKSSPVRPLPSASYCYRCGVGQAHVIAASSSR